MDAHFLFVDPRHGFPVFLFGEQSQIFTDPVLFPPLCLQAISSVGSDQLCRERDFVHTLTAH